ncbi:MAG: cytochrome c oxidase subunit I [Deltaproteobacteria bacterium]|nr:MAG: cytochrome c oxidase subunit I [Deltaproteobacteria bacterium]
MSTHGENYLTAERGWRSWITTRDHKRIGVMYLTVILISVLLGGLFALAVRLHLWNPDGLLVSNDVYNRLFTLHGAVMIFLFIIPGIPAAFGNFVLPMMLGARDVAFPRLNLLSFYLYLAGTVFFLAVLVFGGIDTGWTLYPPYSFESGKGLALLLALLGVFIIGFSSILTGVNFIATMHNMRPKGMGFFDMPLFAWGLYATSIIQVIATPVLGITVALGFVEYLFHIGLFMPEYGGDPVLFQHFFWFYSHPAVYIMILPAMGVVSEVVSVFSRKPIFGYRFIAMSSIAIAIIGFLVWGHHMFVSGQSKWASVIFSVLTLLVAIPSAIKVFNWLATMYRGSIRLDTPMVYVLSFLLLFGVGGLTGLFLGSLSTDVPLHDTYFVVAHFHFVMVGSVLSAFMAALHYWWPKMTGRLYDERIGRWTAVMVLLGFLLTFVPQFIMGAEGAPRRYATYPYEWELLSRLSTVGAFVLGSGMFASLINLLQSLRRGGRRAPANPWGAATLEWFTTSPPDPHNFHGLPPLTGPYNFSVLQYIGGETGWVRRDGYNV